ncbi:unnamed protein product [Ilex paraguariensis]|uniref:Nuclear speckle splicing regulatory protein 1 N-terminal domain-containing protein n=1 Tax=Ilex paraguariensis TaxID=185542 RepID=A0ABC8UUD4_9AQUA
MKKYGLQLRVPPSQHKKQSTRPPLPTPLGFHDDDEDDVEREISRQATKNKALKDPKYIQALMDKAKERERQHEIIYERKLAKERNKDDHLYADKDKFVTSAYKRKLAEQAKWLEEDRLRELREEKEDVTKKGDISDFYFNLSKNVAFGAREAELKKPEKQQEVVVHSSEVVSPSRSLRVDSSRVAKGLQGETSSAPPVGGKSELDDANPVSNASSEEKTEAEPPISDQPKPDHHKKSEDALAAAKERFLARKRAKEH